MLIGLLFKSKLDLDYLCPKPTSKKENTSGRHTC